MTSAGSSADHQIAQLVHGAIGASEARGRRPIVVALATTLALAVAAGPHLPGGRLVLGDVTSTQAALLGATGWLLFLLPGRAGDAALTVLVVLASITVCTMTGRTSAQSLRVRAEAQVLERRLHDEALEENRGRIARELHDGVGSDVMTLTLRLRRAAEEGTAPSLVRARSEFSTRSAASSGPCATSRGRSPSWGR